MSSTLNAADCFADDQYSDQVNIFDVLYTDTSELYLDLLRRHKKSNLIECTVFLSCNYS